MTKCRLTMILASVCLLANSAAAADLIPSAPIPPQILTAKTVFISNASDDCFAAAWSPNSACTRDLFYNEFYAALKSAGKYQIVLSPQDADLVLELSVRGSDYYKLAILDAKTHFTLWSFFEYVEPANLLGTLKKNHLAARARIVTDFKALVTLAETP